MWRIEKGEAMKVILRDNIENLGKRGDIVNVARGYGRNYLIPNKLALEVTPSNMKMVEQQQKALRKKLEKEVKTYQEQVERFNQIQLTFARKSGDKDSIFGSVSLSDISKALEEKGFDIEKKKILLAEPIKKLGTYRIPVKVFHDERAEITLEVIREGGGQEPPKAAEKAAPVPEQTSVPVEKDKPGEPEEPKAPEAESPAEPAVVTGQEGEMPPETQAETAGEQEEDSPAEPEARAPGETPSEPEIPEETATQDEPEPVDPKADE
jgi:large subunit ribosomal protein L9